jgi:hypothetical protein
MAMQGTLRNAVQEIERTKREAAEREYGSAAADYFPDLGGTINPETSARLRTAIANLPDGQRREAERRMTAASVAAREAARVEYGEAKAQFEHYGRQDDPAVRARLKAAEAAFGIPPNRRLIQSDAA